MPVRPIRAFNSLPRLLGFILIVATAGWACAQSGSRSPQPRLRSQPSPTYQVPGSSTRPVPGSGSRAGSATRAPALGLSGLCPVCIIDQKQWVRGTPRQQAVYDGRVYYFPNDEIRRTFQSDPGRYVPALGGDCTVSFATNGQRVPGSVYHSAYHKERLYLFAGEQQKQAFVADAAQFADVDVALDGMCPVCRVDLQQDVAGDPKYAAYLGGMRYLFPGEEQLQRFQASPRRYVPATGSATPPAGSGSRAGSSVR